MQVCLPANLLISSGGPMQPPAGQKRGFSILIATLGSEPQVITAGFDLLLSQGCPVNSIAVIHTSAPGSPIELALQTLQQAFRELHPPIPVTYHPIEKDGHLLADVETPQAGQAAFQLLYRLIWQAKREGKTVHLLVAGGRKTIALFGMAAAQLLFEEGDHLWHLYSGGEFLSSKRMHPRPGDEVHLIPLPVVLWSQVSPVLTDLENIEDARTAMEHIHHLRLVEKSRLVQSFLQEALTPAELRVVKLLSEEGLSDTEIGARLFISPRTVESHLRSAYRKAARHWDLPDVNRMQLIRLVGMYDSTEFRELPDEKKPGTS